MIPILSLLETRVLGVLAEKARTVPDTYPLTLNTLVAGCNQKTSRDPVINATETEVQAAVDNLRAMTLAIESSGNRVARYTHNIERALQLTGPAAAVLTVLMLRGAQTAGELRVNSERLHRFADIGAVESVLRELAEHPAGALAVELSRQSGSRENRWAHLLSGRPAPLEVALTAPDSGVDTGAVAASELATVKANLARLQSEVAALKARLAKVCSELGISA
jgi:uncharacterized protein YceH (UPF0502 family)